MPLLPFCKRRNCIYGKNQAIEFKGNAVKIYSPPPLIKNLGEKLVVVHFTDYPKKYPQERWGRNTGSRCGATGHLPRDCQYQAQIDAFPKHRSENVLSSCSNYYNNREYLNGDLTSRARTFRGESSHHIKTAKKTQHMTRRNGK
ncbi:hypothetical protein CHS0354_010114 [Potamilus streckersoni]|uniref:Uncharacterized protein n=1 Tax=Potamilus streckersoni TaxID=2493646 RepID=A0AAE0VIC9_9BIVA|nr:hypothetical protein CHS0354_010114 [Potamilus streckersoni]